MPSVKAASPSTAPAQPAPATSRGNAVTSPPIIQAPGASRQTIPTAAQPDLQVRLDGEPLYADTPKSRSLTVLPAMNAIYYLRIVNNGATADSYRLNVPDIPNGWQFSVYDMHGTTPSDITSAIRDDYWVSPLLNPGAVYDQLQVVVTGDISLFGSTTPYTLPVTATSQSDATLQDTVQLITSIGGNQQTGMQPDLLIKVDGQADDQYVGGNIFSTAINAELASVTTMPGVAGVYQIQLQNVGNSEDYFTLTSAASVNWTTTYSYGSRDISGYVISTGGWTTPYLGPGETLNLTLSVTPAWSLTPGTTTTTVLMARSVNDMTKKDAIQAKTSVRGSIQTNNAPWPMFRGQSNHRAQSAYRATQAPTVYWGATLNTPVFTQPVIDSDGTVYVGGDDGFIYAVQPGGALKWTSSKTGAYTMTTPAIAGTPDAPRIVVAGSEDGNVYGVNTASGAKAWTFTPKLGISTSISSFTSAPMIGSVNYNSNTATNKAYMVFIGAQNGIFYGVNLANGNQLWSFDTKGQIGFGAALNSFTSYAVGSASVVYFTSTNDYTCHLYAMDAYTGRLVWAYDTTDHTSVGKYLYTAPAIGTDGTIYVGGSVSPRNAKTTTYEGRLFAINMDGTLKWKSPVIGANITSSPAIGPDGTVYVEDDQFHLLALDPATGNIKWGTPSTATDPGYYDYYYYTPPCPVVDRDGTIYYTDNDYYSSYYYYYYYNYGNLYAVNPDGTQKWAYNTGSVTSSPALGADGSIIIGGYDESQYYYYYYYDNSLIALNSFITPQKYSQPDLLIRNAADPVSSALGDQIINTNGQGQTLGLPDNPKVIIPYTTTSYIVHVQNDGSTTDTFNIVGNYTGTSAWNIQYFDSAIGGNNITKQISRQDGGNGWPINVAPGVNYGQYANNSVEIRVQVTPGSVPSSSTCLLQVAAQAQGAIPAPLLPAQAQSTATINADVVQMIVAVPNVPPPPPPPVHVYQPDMMLSADNGATFVGSGIYNTSAVNQQASATVLGGVTARYLARIRNSGDGTDRFLLQATAGVKGWSIVYRDSTGADITAQITGPGWMTAGLAPGAALDITLDVTPNNLTVQQYALSTLITASSITDKTKADAVRAVSNISIWQPDLLIRTSMETSYSGAMIINLDGANQTKMQVASSSAAAYYIIRAQNAGVTTDNFLITASPSVAGWVMKYTNKAGVDISSSVTSTGWSTGPLAPGATIDCNMYATPVSASSGSLMTQTVKATSQGNPQTADVVKTITFMWDGKLAGPWPVFRHDSGRSGKSEFVGPTKPSNAWTLPMGGSVWSSPVVGFDGTIFVGSNANKLIAVIPDGTEKWEYQTGGMVVSTPALSITNTGTYVFVGSTDGNLYALTQQGVCKWKYKTGGAIYSSPVIGSDETIYVGSQDSCLYALTASGAHKWHYRTGGPITSSPAISTNGVIYIGSADGCLYALDLATGKKKWSFQTHGLITDSSPAIGPDGVVYIGSDDQCVYAVKPNGQLKWAYTTDGCVRSSPALSIDGNTVYVGSDDQRIYALNTLNGAQKWSYLTYKPVESSPAVDAGEAIYIGSSDGILYALNADGTLKWNLPTGAGIFSSPALGSDGTIYIGSDDQLLHAIGPGAGRGSLLPDLLLRAKGDASYLGDHLYSTTGLNQVDTQYILPGATATYECKLQNDGTIAGSMRLFGSQGDANWKVAYQDANGNDITTLLTGTGLPVAALSAGGAITFTITVSNTGVASTVKPLFIKVTKVDDSQTVYDTVEAQTNLIIYQPDLSIRNANETALIGGGIFNTTGTGQTKTQVVKALTAATYVVRVLNSGTTADTLTVTGSKSISGWTVTYVDLASQTDITSLITGSGWKLTRLYVGGTKDIQVKVTPSTPGQSTAKTFPVTITAVSTGNSTKKDSVIASTALPQYQPDLLVRTSAETAFSGTGIYSADGSNQIKAQNATTTSPAIYYVRVVNNGNTADSVVISGQATGSNWKATYMDMSNKDITASITGQAGWKISNLAPGVTQDFKVTLQLTNVGAIGALQSLLIKAKSVTDAGKVDAVSVRTTATKVK